MRGVWVVFLAVAAIGCAFLLLGRPGRAPARQLLAIVSIRPQAYLVERVGGGRVGVQALVGPGQSPHTYEPTPAQVAALARADLYFTIHMPFEEQLVQRVTANNKRLRIVDTCRGVTFRSMTAEEQAADHGEGAGHEGGQAREAGVLDPHTWLSPKIAKVQAANICEALKAADPAGAATYEENLRKLQAELDALDARVAAALAPLKGRSMFVFHPAFGYFADEYGLKQVPVEVGGKSPSPKQLASLIRRAKDEGARVIFVEPQFDPKSATAVAEAIGGAVVPIDDLAYDYERNLEEIAAKVQAALAR